MCVYVFSVHNGTGSLHHCSVMMMTMMLMVFADWWPVCHVTSCRYDYVELRDGSSMNAELLGRFCGSTQPSASISSTGQAMFVRFRTDSSVTRTGFKATVSFGRFYNAV